MANELNAELMDIKLAIDEMVDVIETRGQDNIPIIVMGAAIIARQNLNLISNRQDAAVVLYNVGSHFLRVADELKKSSSSSAESYQLVGATATMYMYAAYIMLNEDKFPDYSQK